MQKILLIDDEPDILRVLSMSLRADGYEVFTALSGEDGLSVFEKETPGIVLTDINMPGMDGLKVLRRIKEAESDAEVIMVTGHGDIDLAIEALHYGASDFINKPVKDQALSIALKRAGEKLEIRKKLQEYTGQLEKMVKSATKELERKSNFQAKLIRSSNDGIVATDKNWNIVIFNPGAERIFGFAKTDMTGKTNARELFPAQALDILKRIARLPAADADATWQEMEITTKTGDKLPVRFSGAILHEKGKMMGSVAFFEDLREIKRLEKELVNSERLAAIGQTVAGMAHCIKNILHGFKGGSYLVDIGIDKNKTDKLKSGWAMIQRAIARTSDLVLDLLSYSKERAPEYEPCNPNEIADEVCELVKQNAKDYNIEIIRHLSPDIGNVSMDPRNVYRALLNLVSNAVDACLFDERMNKEHQVCVSTLLKEDNRIRFDVVDNGCGMSDEVKEKLFTSFFSTKGQKGTGLGLLVTRKLVEEHRGTIEMDSQEGEGTRFTLCFPYQRIAEEKKQ